MEQIGNTPVIVVYRFGLYGACFLFGYFIFSHDAVMEELKKDITIVIVTHNMQQATRIADKTAFFLLGELVEFGNTDDIFTSPKDERTERYITGRFG